jgi:hypothetical protein
VRAQQVFALQPINGNQTQQWKTWIKREALNRLLAACFVLDVHTSCYYQQQIHASSVGLDYGPPLRLPIYLSTSTTQLWEAESLQDWQYLGGPLASTTTLSSELMQTVSRSNLADASLFDVAILLAAHAVQLPKAKKYGQLYSPDEVSVQEEAEMGMEMLFGDSPCANAYMALSCTPLHALLSVSGDSWLFNQKVLDRNLFASHKEELMQWRESNRCQRAVIYAARSLKQFTNMRLGADGSKTKPRTEKDKPWERKDISDYWGIYACALICWAYSCRASDMNTHTMDSQSAALRWIQMTADVKTGEGGLVEAGAAKGVVGLAKELLAGDNLGGCNRLLADAVGVLTQLQDNGGPAF